MGGCLASSVFKGSNDGVDDSHDCMDENWVYVEAILKPQYLDWRQHVNDEATRQEILATQRNPPVPIMEDVFLAGATAMMDETRLVSLGITHILNVAGKESQQGEQQQHQQRKPSFICKTIEAKDRKGYAMLENHLNECREFIADCRQSGGKCVVHCQAGANRSGVIVAAELMLTERKSVLEVVYHCRKQRGSTFLCNQTFIEELVALASKKGLLGPKPGENGYVVKHRMSRQQQDHY